MRSVSVWAPEAERVDIEGAEGVLPMMRGDSGWWRIEAPWLLDGADYRFLVDGEGPFPDPRSPSQPEGVHGPSRIVDHGRHAWSDGGWQAPPFAAAAVEEIHIGTFTAEGSFDAAIARLPRLSDLGITHVELMPVAEFDGSRGWGYDGVNLYAPHHSYGGPEGMKRFVDACHGRGLAVILDVVYNHLGPSGNYLGRFGPYFTDAYQTPWGQAVNLDQAGSGEVRRFFIDNALMWLQDYHVDGLRIDAVHAMFDRSAIHFLEQLAAEVRGLEARLGRHFVLIAESDLNDPRLVKPVEAGGYGLDAMWNEDFHHSLQAALSGERHGYYRDFGRIADIAKVLADGQVYDGRYSVYRDRMHGRPTAGLPGRRFVGCLQNHDQVGNRALGERSSHLMSPGLLRTGAALVLTSPFVPMLFQGEEWGASTPFLYFTDFEDPALGKAVKEGRRKEFAAFGWDPASIPDPQAEASFRRSCLDWEEAASEPHAGIWRWHKALLRLRRELPGLSDDRPGRLALRYDEAARWIWVQRGGVLVACNLDGRGQRIACPEAAGKELLLASDEGVRIDAGELELPPESVVILAAAGERGASGGVQVPPSGGIA